MSRTGEKSRTCLSSLIGCSNIWVWGSKGFLEGVYISSSSWSFTALEMEGRNERGAAGFSMVSRSGVWFSKPGLTTQNKGLLAKGREPIHKLGEETCWPDQEDQKQKSDGKGDDYSGTAWALQDREQTVCWEETGWGNVLGRFVENWRGEGGTQGWSPMTICRPTDSEAKGAWYFNTRWNYDLTRVSENRNLAHDSNMVGRGGALFKQQKWWKGNSTLNLKRTECI